MQPREQSSLGHGLSRYTTQAMQLREQNSLGHGLSRYTTQAMQPREQSSLGHGLSPYKKTISITTYYQFYKNVLYAKYDTDAAVQNATT